MTRSSEGDMTPWLTHFEKISFQISHKYLFRPSYLLEILDDDLSGNIARDNQIKYLIPREADKEGHRADVIADALP